MSGESIPVFGDTVAMVISGASLADTVFSSAVTAPYADVHGMADIVFEGVFAVAPAAGKSLHLYRRDLDIKGTSDNPLPDASYKEQYIGSIPLDLVTNQAIQLSGVRLSNNCEIYIENDSGQTLNGGWTLDIKPFGWGINP